MTPNKVKHFQEWLEGFLVNKKTFKKRLNK
jgi:hypothetical protein